MLMSECPPVRYSPRTIKTEGPIWKELEGNSELQWWFESSGSGTSLLHIYSTSHAREVSQTVFRELLARRDEQDEIMHFSFADNDARFGNTRGMLIHFLGQILRCLIWPDDDLIPRALGHLHAYRAWSLVDIYQCFETLRSDHRLRNVWFMISCVDEGDESIYWVLDKIQEYGKYFEAPFRLVVTSNGSERAT